MRRSLGMVLQDTHLFTGTIADNIRFGKLDATQEEIEKAARIANADSFIRRLPKGYDTLVGDGGGSLSGGERQRIAIARAILKNSPVVVLDEATAFTDPENEAVIQASINELVKGKTLIVIAHRLSTVRNSDAIMVLEHGRIIERGTHEELLKKRGLYYQTFKVQYGEEEMEWQ